MTRPKHHRTRVITFRLGTAQENRLRAESEHTGLSVAEIIRAAIAFWLKVRPKSHEEPPEDAPADEEQEP